ncbi:hypothetical protein [Amycolatopsis sp. CA-126428]|uniref:hypothetical protein n=1 Tax=Amycolatopsis sp. CA-126428 TaxID=2073158 RepID=UPI000CD070F5|nr:hypothetical protein [Amycolatopsis sp. CA-126428]
MTGPEHYREAERLIRASSGDYVEAGDALAEAQVHATLALAAATASGAWAEMSDDESRSWDKAIGVER